MLLLRDGEGAAAVTRREDYTVPAWWIDTVDLTFDLDPAKTRVLNKMRLRRNSAVPPQALRLDGEDLNLARVLVNGQGTSFKMEGNQLVLENLPEGGDPVDLEIFTTCAPAKNTKLMGLYVSNDSFFTQCEAEGFRRITYFLDRPDVMALYTVTLKADKASTRYCCPTAIWLTKVNCRAQKMPAAILPSGSTPTKSRVTCLPWSPVNWCAASSASFHAAEKTTSCRFLCARATWTKPNTR